MSIDNKDFRNKKQQMLNLLDAIERLARERGKPAIGNAMKTQSDHLRKGELNVVVCGECRRGKSSLLNAFLEVDGICPVDAPVTTNSITRIAYGEQERFSVNFKENGASKTKEISREEIWKYVTEEANPSGGGLEVERLDILLPSPKLKDGLVLYDTPGVGSLNSAHTATTMRFIPFADAVLFVGSANEPLATGELKFLQDIARNRPHILHVLTKRDVPNDPEEILAGNLRKIEATLKAPEGSVKGISVSSMAKLLYLEDHDPIDLQKSQFPQFEQAIWDLLQRGGDILLRRTQSNGLLALSQLLPPIEAERAALAASSQAELDALDSQLSEQQERGRQVLGKSEDWKTGLREKGAKLLSRCQEETEEEFLDIQRTIDGLLQDVEDNDFLRSPARLNDRLETECSGAFKRVVDSLDEGLGNIVAELRRKTDLNPKRVGVTAETDFEFSLQRPNIRTSSGLDKAVDAGGTALRTASVAGVVASAAVALSLFAPWVAIPVAVVALGYGARKGAKEIERREWGEIKALVSREATMQLGHARNRAMRQLNQIYSDAIKLTEKNLQDEVKGKLDACQEARDKVQKVRVMRGAELDKAKREVENLYRSTVSWKKGLEDLVPFGDSQYSSSEANEA